MQNLFLIQEDGQHYVLVFFVWKLQEKFTLLVTVNAGGSCWYANGETGHDTGPWRLNKNYLPEELYPYADEMLAKFNANVPFGYCGGCE